MAKKAYVGVDSVARKIAKGYVGVDNTARKIKKAYIGVAGIARPFWGGGTVSYYGVLDYPGELSTAAGTELPSYAIFGGGGQASMDVYAYDSSLTRHYVEFNNIGSWTAAAKAGSYALFAGGRS